MEHKNMESTTQDTSSGAVDRLVRKHNMSREEAQEILADAQADTEKPTVCSECGAAEDRESGVAVENYPDPVSGDRRPLCSSCFADWASELTLLSRQQAEILALEYAGWSPSEVASALGMDSGNLSGQRRRADQKGEQAVEQIDEGQRTLLVLGELRNER